VNVAQPTHVAVILAAGGSARLGMPKQLLTRSGEPLVRRVVRLAAATSPLRTVVVLGAHAEAVRATLVGLACETVSNDRWPEGLATSVRTGAAALASHAGPMLLIACDQPALEAQHLETLLALARAASSGCAATLHGAVRGPPAVVSPEIRARVHELEGDRGLRAVLASLRPGAVGELDAPELCMDIDDTDGLAAAVAAGLVDDPLGTGDTR